MTGLSACDIASPKSRPHSLQPRCTHANIFPQSKQDAHCQGGLTRGQSSIRLSTSVAMSVTDKPEIVGKTAAVTIRFRRPSPESLRRLLEAARDDSLSYSPAGVSSLNACPAGYRRDLWTLTLGSGDAVFDRARNALRTWQIHQGAGFVVLADGPPAVGAVVALSAPLPVGFIDATCRVIDLVDRDDCYGFAHGTLSAHPERGEESFTVVRRSDANIVVEIVAVSRPRHPLARACPPVARALQRKATNRYLATMRTAALT